MSFPGPSGQVVAGVRYEKNAEDRIVFLRQGEPPFRVWGPSGGPIQASYYEVINARSEIFTRNLHDHSHSLPIQFDGS